MLGLLCLWVLWSSAAPATAHDTCMEFCLHTLFEEGLEDIFYEEPNEACDIFGDVDQDGNPRCSNTEECNVPPTASFFQEDDCDGCDCGDYDCIARENCLIVVCGQCLGRDSQVEIVSQVESDSQVESAASQVESAWSSSTISEEDVFCVSRLCRSKGERMNGGSSDLVDCVCEELDWNFHDNFIQHFDDRSQCIERLEFLL